MAFVRITHPDVDGEADVSDRALTHHQANGWELVGHAPDPNNTDAPDPHVQAPAKNGTTDEWRAYAIHRGMTADVANQLGRDELVAHYTEES